MDYNIKPKTIVYYELFEILNQMEQMGFIPQRKIWKEYFCEVGVNNDTIQFIPFDYFEGDIRHDIYKEYFDEVRRLLGIGDDVTGIMVNISW